MSEPSSPILPPAEEYIEAETGAALEPGTESDEFAPEYAEEHDFVCDSDEWMRSACTGLPFYREHEGRSYCVLHYPSQDKSADFKTALDTKLKQEDFDFRGVWFPDEVDFRGIAFVSDVSFFGAWFLELVRFARVTFRGNADFRKARFFKDVEFQLCHIHGRCRFWTGNL